MRALLAIWVPGEPVPQGSMESLVPTHPKTKQPYRRAGGGIIVNTKASNEKTLNPWRSKIADAAELAWMGRDLLADEPLVVECDFFLKRPDGHWGTGKNAHLLKDHVPAAPIVYPDVDKMLRAVLDALTGIVYKDDALIVAAPCEKHYAVPDGSEHEGMGVYIRLLRAERRFASELPPEQRLRHVPAREPVVDDAQLPLVT